MNVLDERFKSFAFSSISENDEYKKLYIVSLHNDDNIKYNDNNSKKEFYNDP